MNENKLNELISQLDTIVGMLLIPSMKNDTVKQAMEKVSEVSLELGNIIDELD